MRFPSVVLLLLACKLCAWDGAPRFSGEVFSGHEYRHSIGRGLFFVLEPTDSGWMIQIVPEKRCSDYGDDWATVVNGPFRNYNALYVDAAYGITAAQAVKEMNPRTFSFVLTCADYRREGNRLDIVLWPYTYSRQEQKAAQAKLGSAPQAKAKFTILDSKVSPLISNGNNFGRIDWLRFRLDVISWPGLPDGSAR